MILWDQIREYFERDGVRFDEREGAVNVIDADITLAESELQIRVVYDERNGVVSYVVPELGLPKRLHRNRNELRRALLLLNSCYILGAFTENPHGRVSFEITVLIEGNELPYEVHRRMMGAALASVDRALPWLRQVAMGAISADEAVENIAEMSRRADERRATETLALPGPDDGAGHITERELEEFGRALLEGGLPPPLE